MSILDRITRALRAPMPALLPIEQRQIGTYNYASWQLGKPVWPKATLGTYFGYYDQVVIAFACINLIADAAAAAKVRVYDESKDDAELPDHPMRQLLSRPNDYMSEAEFYNTMVKLAAVSGFAVAEKERSGAGRVIGLHPLRSDWLKAVPRENNMTDWEYQLPSGEKYPLLGEDVIAWTYQGGPAMSATGTTPLAAANRELAIENSMVNFTKAFFDGGGVPMTGLVLDENATFSQAQADVLREKFMQLAQEPWRPVVLDAFKDVKRLGFDLNEMAYKDLRHLTSTQISTAFRVPPVMLGTLAGLENSPWSKYEEARRSFYEDTITPLWARLDGALTRSLLPEFDSNPRISLEFDTSDIPAFQDDDSQDWAKVGAAILQGWVTVNDGRGIVGLPNVSGGDVFLRSIAQVEVPAVEQNGARSNGHIEELTDVWPEIYRDMTKQLNGNGHTRALPSGAMYRLPPEQRATIAAASKATVARIGERSAPLLRKFWKAQGERVIGALGLRDWVPTAPARTTINLSSNIHDQPSLRAVDVIDWDEEERLLQEVMQKVYALNGKAAFDAVSDLLKVDVAWDVANPNVQRVLGDLGRRVAGISDTTRTDVQRVVGDALNEGVPLKDLGDRLTGLFEETYKGRAATVARTESQVAYNTASTLGYQESGVVDSVELVDNPAHTDDYGASDGLSCADRDGLIVPLDRVDIHIEAEHPNGSLAVIPVLSTALGEE